MCCICHVISQFSPDDRLTLESGVPLFTRIGKKKLKNSKLPSTFESSG
jgi:hypothetical protein